jgi:hypothetical protein
MQKNGKDIFPSGNPGQLGFSLFKGFFALWLGWALVCLVGGAALVYVAIHFISKFW